MHIAIEGPKLTLVYLGNILDILKDKILYFTVGII